MTESYTKDFILSPVAVPGFPRGGSANPRGGGAPTRYLTNFPRKMQGNKEILALTGGGGGRPSQLNVDSKTRLKFQYLSTRSSGSLPLSLTDSRGGG